MSAINLEEILRSEKLEKIVKESDFGYVGSVYYTKKGLVIATYENAPEAPIVLRVYKKPKAYPGKQDITELFMAYDANENFTPSINPVAAVISKGSTTLSQVYRKVPYITNQLDRFFTKRRRHGIPLTEFAKALDELGIRAIAYPNHQIPPEIKKFENSMVARLSDYSPFSFSGDDSNLGVPSSMNTTEGATALILNPAISARDPSNRGPRVIEYHG